MTDALSVPQKQAGRWSALRHTWAELPRQRKIIWGIAIVLATLHLLVLAWQIVVIEEYTPDEIRDWSDVVAYLDAGEAFRARAELYELTTWEDPMTYYYHPVFAMAASVVVDWPFRFVSIVWFGLQAAAYLGALVVWYKVLSELQLEAETKAYMQWLPLTIVFTEWYVNLMYGNLTSLLLLLSGGLTLLLLRKHPGRAALIALPIVIVKPQWLFPLVIPVLLRQWRLLLTTAILIVAGYLVITGVYVVAVGPDYGIETLEDYGTFLTTLNDNYEWGGQTYNFEDYNHSWRQILLSYWGEQDWVPVISELLKVALILPVLWMIRRAWQNARVLAENPQIIVWFVGLTYLLAMAMLAQLWEVLGSIIFFMVLQATPDRRFRRISWLYMLYAVYVLPAMVSFMTGIDALYLPESVPLSMLALLFIYSLLLVRVHQSLTPVAIEGNDA